MNITDHFRQTFADSFRETVQQSQSRLRKGVNTMTGLTGVGKQIDFVLPLEDEETTGQRYKKTVLRDLETNCRWYYPRSFDIPSGEAKWDEKLLAPTVMPGGKHVRAHAAAFNRRCDNIIMEGLLGDARVGKTGEIATPLPSSQIVAVDFVNSGSAVDSGFTVAKLIEAIRILKAKEAWNEDVRNAGVKLWGVIDATEEARLKQTANTWGSDRLFSEDYTPPVYDDNGVLISFLGVNFISYEKLLTGTSGSTSIKKCAIWTTDAVEFGIWADMQTSVDLRPDLSNAVQFLSQYMLGAGREQEEKVVQINCKA